MMKIIRYAVVPAACLGLEACAPLPAPQEAPVVPAPVAVEAPVSAAPAEREYHLGPGDVIRITVYDNPDLATESEIAENGSISFPLIGAVMLGGLSRGDAERAISEKLGSGGFVPNAHVNLLVQQYRSRQVAVMGEVNKPGNYPISRATSIAEMLAMAGGISAKGGDRVTVIRRDASGQSQRYEMDVRRLFASGDPSAYSLVDKGDIIFVPSTPVFYIYGEVRQPGAYPLVSNMTVMQALSVGGGLTGRGTERGIRIERRGPDGTVKAYTARGPERLQPNDVLRILESWF